MKELQHIDFERDKNHKSVKETIKEINQLLNFIPQ